jgi:purine nucleoside permease
VNFARLTNVPNRPDRCPLAAVAAAGLLATLPLLSNVVQAASATVPPPATTAVAAPVPVKVVVVSMFETGAVTGDEPGEMQRWVERLKADRVYPFPMGEYELRMTADGVLILCTGGGITNAATSVLALGTDPRFDLTKAYWLIAGIAGGDPLDVSLGTAAWAKHVVDGDLTYEIDAREMPADWAYGRLPLGGKKPNDKATGWTVDTIHFPLNPKLADWAYSLTKDSPVEDSPGIAAFRAQFTGYPNAVRPPFVTIGDTLSSSTYIHGLHLTTWANDWMKLQAGPGANLMMSAMEDSGSLTALRRLSRAKLVDLDRVMVLRTASNYMQAPPGKETSWSTTAEYPENGRPAGEAAFKVGNIVVQALLEGWASYRDRPPGQ